MSQDHKVSVILTSYNHAKYLRQSIESVLDQTYSDFDFIIWDDGSTDESWEIIQGFSDPRIRAIRNKTDLRGSPIRSAFSKVLTREYIAIHHSDDIWEPNKLEKQVAFLDDNPVIGAVFSNALIIDDNGALFTDEVHFYHQIFNQPNRSRFEWLNYFFYRGNALCHPSVLIRKQCYLDCGLYRYGLGQIADFDMWIRLCLKYEIYVMSEKLVRFRIHSQEMNTSTDRPEVRIRGQFEYLQVLNNYRKITTFEELVKVFPIAEKYIEPDDVDLDFALGMVALEAKPYKFTELFGLNILFEVFNDKRRMKKIKEVYGFTHNDFITLTGKHDVFSTMVVENLKTQLTEKEQQLAQKEQQLAQKEHELASIKNSIYWKLVLILKRIRYTLIPHRSRRERLISITIETYYKLRDEGLRALLKVVYRRLFSSSIISIQPSVNAIKPMVSIVIPVFNAASFTKNCIEQIYKVHTEVPFEVIVVDNGSKDRTKLLLNEEQKRRQNFRLFRMPSNLGFGGAVNYGCRQASGNHIIILNNDTLVTSGWLDKLLEPFHKDKSIGIVSPITNYVGEGPQIDPDAVNISSDEIESYAEKIKDRDYIHESNRLVFFCVAIKKEVLDIVGDLDIGYEKGNYEDDDFCMRTIVAGFRLAIARGAFVYHFGTITFKKNRISHNEYMERNRKRFYQKAQNIAITLRPPTLHKSDMLVSVIVRTLNRPELLQKALTSLSNQTLKVFEVVVVNDGGDNISSSLSKFENHYPVDYVHNNKSYGRTAALNIGVKRSRGKWISFLDDDDIIYPWHLDTLVSTARLQRDTNVLYSDYNKSLFLSGQSNYPQITLGVEPWEYDPHKLLVRNYMPIHTWMIARECFNEIGYFNENQEMLEDYEFLLRLSKVFSFYHVKRFTCEYRFYMDGINSLTTHRWKTLDALRFIYNQNPVADPGLAQARKYELQSLENQIETIKKLQSSTKENPTNEVNVNREIIHLITGM